MSETPLLHSASATATATFPPAAQAQKGGQGGGDRTTSPVKHVDKKEDLGFHRKSVLAIFVCQRCNHSVRITQAMHLDRNSARLSTDSINGQLKMAKKNRMSTSYGSERQQMAWEWFGRASHEAEVDFMLCQDCIAATETNMVEELQMKLAESETLKQRKKAYLRQFGVAAQSGKVRSVVNHNLLEEALDEERELLQDLERLEARNTMLKAEHMQVDSALEHLLTKEGQYWDLCNAFVQENDSFASQWQSAKQQVASRSKDLQRLNTTNVFNDAFYIWFEGFFGTINGLRMGRLNSTAYHDPVNWNETNAAWGMACMLLSALEKRIRRQPRRIISNRSTLGGSSSHGSKGRRRQYTSLGFQFTKYRPVPMGSYSRIELIDGSAGWDLIGGGGGMFWQSKYDKALIGFLRCMKELEDYAMRQSDNQFSFLHKITEEERVGGLTIKYSAASDENWTKACKYVLINIKYLIVWCSSM